MTPNESRRENADGQRDIRAIISGDRAGLTVQLEYQAGLSRLLASKDVSADTRANLERKIGGKCDEISASAGILDEVARRFGR